MPRRIAGHQKNSGGIPIYGYHVESGLYKEWSSINIAAYSITGKRDNNLVLIRKKILGKVPYHGWMLQEQPFKKKG